jgi:PAS domain S-box-containing protein
MPGLRPDDSPAVEARLLQTLYALSSSARRTLDPGELLRLAAEHACELLHGDAVVLYLRDEDTGLLTPVFSNDPRQPAEDRPIEPGQGAAGQSVERREPVIVDDYQHWPLAIEGARVRGLQAIQAVPLIVGDRALGALVVRFYGERYVLAADEARILTLFAAQVAPALEAARLYATSNLERQHERALREITQALAANLDERRVLELAVGHGARLLGAPYARIWLLETSGDLSCAAAEGFVHPETFHRRLARESISGRAARQEIVNLRDAPAESSWRFNREFGERTGLGAYLGAGLWRAGESLGVLEVMREVGHRFSRLEEQLLVSLANTVAVAVSNARTHAAVEDLAAQADQRAAAARESEQEIRSIYQAIGSGVLVYDADGHIITANAEAEGILGRGRGELIGKQVSDFRPPIGEDGRPLAITDRPSARAFRSGVPLRKFVFGITRTDGELRWLQIDAVPLLAADGTVRRVISSFIDITARKRSEQLLQQRDRILEAVAFAAERLLTAADWVHSIDDVLRQLGAATGASRVYIAPAAADGVVEPGPRQWTTEGVDIRVDVPYLAATGLGRWEEVLRGGGTIQGALRSFPPAERDVLTLQQVCSTVVVPIFAETQWWGFIGFDDCEVERAWPSGTVEVLKTAAGTIGAAIVRRRAEAERLQLVREQAARAEAEAGQRRLALLAEASQILASSLDSESTLQEVADLVVPAEADGCVVVLCDFDGSIRRVAAAVSPQFAGRLVERAGSVLARDADDPVARVIQTGKPHFAPRLTDSAFAAGLIVPLVSRGAPTGALTWLVGDARAPLTQAQLELAQDLARRCALAIDNARLYHEARVAVTIRDEFLSVAAHELKTPMTSLRGYAQLLYREFDRPEGANPERTRRAATTIQVQSDKLARLVSQLLDISRLQSGKLMIEPRDADLTTLVQDVVDAARTQLKRHTIVADLVPELWAYVDPLRIEQVVTNLVDNAIKYSPDGGLIEISLIRTLEEQVRLVIRDHGVGVPVEHRAHIFDRFYQARADGVLTSMAGMGLGLYISREIVEQHGGTIGAEFPSDGGTRMIVLLAVDPRLPTPAP